MEELYRTFAPFIKPNSGLYSNNVLQNTDNDKKQAPSFTTSQLERSPLQDTAKFSNSSPDKTKPRNNAGSLALGGIASTIPVFKRLETVIDCFKNGESFKGIGKGLIALLNFSDDSSDTRQIKETSKDKFYDQLSDYKETMLNKEGIVKQRKFTFLKSTPVGRFAKKHPWLENWINKFDKTLIDSEWLQNIIKKLDKTARIIIDDNTTRIIKPLWSGKEFIVNCGIVKVEGKYLTKLLTKAFARTTRLNILASLALEIPAVINAFKDKNGENGIARSLTTVTSVIACGSLLGALMPTGVLGLVGLGVGTWIGGKIAGKINDTFFFKKTNQ